MKCIINILLAITLTLTILSFSITPIFKNNNLETILEDTNLLEEVKSLRSNDDNKIGIIIDEFYSTMEKYSIPTILIDKIVESNSFKALFLKACNNIKDYIVTNNSTTILTTDDINEVLSSNLLFVNKDTFTSISKSIASKLPTTNELTSKYNIQITVLRIMNSILTKVILIIIDLLLITSLIFLNKEKYKYLKYLSISLITSIFISLLILLIIPYFSSLESLLRILTIYIIKSISIYLLIIFSISILLLIIYYKKKKRAVPNHSSFTISWKLEDNPSFISNKLLFSSSSFWL